MYNTYIFKNVYILIEYFWISRSAISPDVGQVGRYRPTYPREVKTVERWIAYVCHSEGEWARQKM